MVNYPIGISAIFTLLFTTTALATTSLTEGSCYCRATTTPRIHYELPTSRSYCLYNDAINQYVEDDVLEKGVMSGC